jgi:hypothetical protein
LNTDPVGPFAKVSFLVKRGDGRVVLYKRADRQNPKWTARLKTPEAEGLVVKSTKTIDFEARRFAEELYYDPSESSKWPFCLPQLLSGPRQRGLPYAGLLSATFAYVEKVRPQFLSLRQLALGSVFSGRTSWQLAQ